MDFAQICGDRVLKISHVLSPYVKKFGEDCISLRTFETNQLTDGDVVTDFLQFTEIDQSIAQAHPPTRVNPSFSVAQGLVAAHIYAIIRKFLEDAGMSVRWFVGPIRMMTRTAAEQLGSMMDINADVLSHQQREKLLSMYIEDNREVAKRYGLPAKCQFVSTSIHQEVKPQTNWMVEQLQDLPKTQQDKRAKLFAQQIIKTLNLILGRN